VVGADLSIFLTENAAGTDGWRAIPGRLNTFVSVGLLGRFDFVEERPARTE